MKYTFELLGVSPILTFFNHQHRQSEAAGAAYIGSYHCTLDAVLASLEPVPPRRGWEMDTVVDTVIQFWVNNAEQVRHWRSRLEDAGNQSVIVARVADVQLLRSEFETLFRD
jgi:hypothetical protein